MNKQYQRCLIPISRERGIYNENSIKLRSGYPYYIYEYYLWFWVEFSKSKTKRRKRNKQARKQRKLNNRN